tara:strand:- start:4473 stop:5504 length:1032 start_codon:yes stop_codon:yes gene_type:complete
MSEPVAGSIAGTLLDAKWEMDVLCTHDQDRKEWEEIRSGFNGMTGSVAPILYGAVGYNDLETEYSYRTGKLEREHPGFMAIRGQVLEPYILAEAEKLPVADRVLRWKRCKDSPLFVRHHSIEWAACSPDFVAYSTDPAICSQYGGRVGKRMRFEPVRVMAEIKSRDGTQAYKYRDGSCQLSERVQVAWNMACTDADVGLLIVSMFGSLHYIVIERDLVFEAEMLSGANKFLEAVKAEDLSALIDLSNFAEEQWAIICSSFDAVDGAEILEPDPKIDQIVAEIAKHRLKKKEAENAVKRNSILIGKAMRTATRLQTENFSVSWPKLKSGKRGGLRIKEKICDKS